MSLPLPSPGERTRAPLRLRGLAAGVVVVALSLMVLLGALVALEVIDPKDGVGHDIVDVLDGQIGENEQVRYALHQALGRIFSVCPCTAAWSRTQFEKAWYHRPSPTPATPSPRP